MAENL
jgi:hypothetical protein